MAKSLYEAKVEKRKKLNPNIITDMDYMFRDKKNPSDRVNTINMTPSPKPTATKAVKGGE